MMMMKDRRRFPLSRKEEKDEFFKLKRKGPYFSSLKNEIVFLLFSTERSVFFFFSHINGLGVPPNLGENTTFQRNQEKKRNIFSNIQENEIQQRIFFFPLSLKEKKKFCFVLIFKCFQSRKEKRKTKKLKQPTNKKKKLLIQLFFLFLQKEQIHNPHKYPSTSHIKKKKRKNKNLFSEKKI